MVIKGIVLAAYVAMIVAIGIMGMRKTRSFSDFFLGGGGVGPWMTAFTYAASYFSAVLFIGFAGKIGWAFGYSGLWIAVGNSLIGVLAVWALIGHRVKRIASETGAHTMPEYLAARYDSPSLKLFGSLSVFVFFVPYSAAVFMGLSYLFTSNFDMPYWAALAVIGGFTALYMVMGGYKSMAMIDVAFGIIMIAGVCILLGFTLHKGGGFDKISQDLAAINPKLTALEGPPGAWAIFCLVFLTSVAPFGMPQLVQKFYAIKDRRSIRIGTIASTCLAMLIGSIAYFVGSTTRLFLTPETTPGAFDAGSGKPVFDRLMPELLANVVPESLSVLMLLLVLSASMSTLAALVLISSSAVVKDFYAGFVNRDAPDKRLTLFMRLASILFILVSVGLAAGEFQTIVSILAVSWGAIGSVFLGPFVWGLFTTWTNKTGAIASAVLGLGVCLGLYFYDLCVAGGTGNSPQAGTIGMLVSLAANPLFSLLTLKRTPATTAA